MNPAVWTVLETKDAMRALYAASKRPGSSRSELSEAMDPAAFYSGAGPDVSEALDVLRLAGLVQVLRSDRTDSERIYPTVKGARVAQHMEGALQAMEVRCRRGVQRPNALYIPMTWGGMT